MTKKKKKLKEAYNTIFVYYELTKRSSTPKIKCSPENAAQSSGVENTGHRYARNVAYGKLFLRKLSDSCTRATTVNVEHISKCRLYSLIVELTKRHYNNVLPIFATVFLLFCIVMTLLLIYHFVNYFISRHFQLHSM